MENSVIFDINAERLPVVSMTDIARVKPPYIHFRRQYHEYIFYYILEGEMYLREGEEEYHLVENDCILLDPTRKHVGYRTSVCNFLYVHFSQDIMHPFPTALSSLISCMCISHRISES